MSLVNIQPPEGRQIHKTILSNTAWKRLRASSEDYMGAKARLGMWEGF